MKPLWTEMVILCHILQGRPDFIMLTFREWKARWNQTHRQMSRQASISQFRMTFPVTEYIPSFHLPVDFPHKMQIAQPLQGWFEDVDYVILIELCNKNTLWIFFPTIKTLLME